MLQPCEVIDADVVGYLCVVLAISAHMNQRASASPVLIRCVGEENLRHNFVGSGAVEQPSSLSRYRILLGLIRKREDVCREEDGRCRLRIARRLREAVVEAAAACSGNVGENAVKRNPAIFVGVETFIKKIAKKAPVLRDAFAIDAHRRSYRVRSMFGIRSEITDGSKAQARDDWIGNHVDIFIDLAWMKAAVEMDEAVAGRELAIDGVRESPLRARNDGAQRLARVAHRQHIARIVRRSHRILSSAHASGDPVTKRDFCHLLRRHEIAAQQAGDRLSIFPGDGNIEVQGVTARGVPLPAKAREGEAVAQQPPIARVLGGIPVAAIDEGKDAAITAVRIFQKH